MIRIKLPGENYKAQLWSNKLKAFLNIESDVLESKHYKKNGKILLDYEMFINS